MTDGTEELTIGKARIRREKGADGTVTIFYFRYNVEYFNGNLPQLKVHWADEIFEGDSVHALFVPEEQTPRQESFIVISSKLKELDSFQHLCLLHEMVHVRLSAPFTVTRGNSSKNSSVFWTRIGGKCCLPSTNRCPDNSGRRSARSYGRAEGNA
jgi:hypothetical protein